MHPIVFDGGMEAERVVRTLADSRKSTGRYLSDYCTDPGPNCVLETLRDQAISDRERHSWELRGHHI